MRAFLFIIFILSGLVLSSQDTIRMMQYNLLMYGNNFGGCTSGNNNVNNKNGYFKTIVEYVKPDIVFVNELSEEESFHDLILNSVFNVNNSDWSRGNVNNLANSFIVNQVYYKNQKFELTNYVAVQTNVRDIDIFGFNILPSDKSNLPEPIEINCAVAHLKAGSDFENVQERAYETNKLMNYLNNSGADGNFTFSGDFNLYSGSELALQNLLNYANPDIRFFDPINQIGNWNNNGFYANIHTQSTHENGDCFSGGGMDDRFDFFLVSQEILEGSNKIKYLENSYFAVGQDGEHFNNSLTSSPTNTSVPGNVLNALYNMSDHLPVVIDIVVDHNLFIQHNYSATFDFTINNPVKEVLEINIQDPNFASYQVHISDLLGRPVSEASIPPGVNKINLPLEGLKQGVYFISLIRENAFSSTRKFIVH
ncbi:MAG: T9SS type A sorting domain-containing protein [Bacteroidetes bacterium]|nr:T9SS type A sorting domain-containing protein [Bacteroidota bacterium]